MEYYIIITIEYEYGFGFFPVDITSVYIYSEKGEISEKNKRLINI